MTSPRDDPIAQALDDLARGDPVLIFDDATREGETDIFFAAEHVTHEEVATLRRDAGGLVFAAVDPTIAGILDLPFLHHLLHDGRQAHPVLGELVPDRLPYDARPSFSVTLNHRETYTGVTDVDRALTVRELAKLAARAPELGPEAAQRALGEAFRAPGHVHLCVGAEDLLDDREGHTELALALARMAGITPVVAGCEMLGHRDALPLEDARAWARDHGTRVVTGDEVRQAWEASTRTTAAPRSR